MQHDLFICHASADKPTVVDPLVQALEERGLSVWLDRMQIRIGDSLTKKIDEGLRSSRFGVVVISRAVLSKETGWVRRELDALAAREAQLGDVVLLPVWHEVSSAEVFEYSPTLSTKLAAQTSSGLSAVVDMIVERCDETSQNSRRTPPEQDARAEKSAPSYSVTMPVRGLSEEIERHDRYQVTQSLERLNDFAADVTQQSTLSLLTTVRGLAALSELGLLLLAGDVVIELNWHEDRIVVEYDPGSQFGIEYVKWLPNMSTTDFASQLGRSLQRTGHGSEAIGAVKGLFHQIETGARIGIGSRLSKRAGILAEAEVVHEGISPILSVVNPQWCVTEAGVELIAPDPFLIRWSDIEEAHSLHAERAAGASLEFGPLLAAITVAKRFWESGLEFRLADVQRRW